MGVGGGAVLGFNSITFTFDPVSGQRGVTYSSPSFNGQIFDGASVRNAPTRGVSQKFSTETGAGSTSTSTCTQKVIIQFYLFKNGEGLPPKLPGLHQYSDANPIYPAYFPP